jgi:flagellar protein FlbT
MPLKVELKPGERIILGDSVITNGDQRTRIVIEGEAPILREKDIMTRKAANSPAKRIYLAIQLMYTSKDPGSHHDIYFSLMRDLLRAAPSMWGIVENINNHILTGEMYKALKSAQKLIAREEELLSDAQRRQSVSNSRNADLKSA